MNSLRVTGAVLAASLVGPLQGCDRAQPPALPATGSRPLPPAAPPLSALRLEPPPDAAARCLALAIEAAPGHFAPEQALVLDTATSPSAATEGRALRRVRLLLESYYAPSGDPRVRDTALVWNVNAATWEARGPDSLLVVAGYGFSARAVALAGVGDTLRGASAYSSDIGERPPLAATVALRVPCSALASGDSGAVRALIRGARRALGTGGGGH